jgi:hypothetical protein
LHRYLADQKQEQWLFQNLDKSQAQWNVIAQQTMLAKYDFDARPESKFFNLDQWDGYVEARNRLLGFLNRRQPSNPVVVRGATRKCEIGFYISMSLEDKSSRERILDGRTTSRTVEGINNKLKLIKRLGYGFRNFTNFRLRSLLNWHFTINSP